MLRPYILKMIVSYLKYRIKAQGKYHLHSPLVYGLYENVLEKVKEVPRSARNDNGFYDNLDDWLSDFINDNPLIFKDEDAVTVVRDIHRDRQKEAEWERLKDDERVRLSIDCWRFGIIFVMNRIEKEHYILKI